MSRIITRSTISQLEVGMRVEAYGYLYGVIVKINAGATPSEQYITILWGHKSSKQNYHYDCGFRIIELDKKEIAHLIDKLEI